MEGIKKWMNEEFEIGRPVMEFLNRAAQLRTLLLRFSQPVRVYAD